MIEGGGWRRDGMVTLTVTGKNYYEQTLSEVIFFLNDFKIGITFFLIRRIIRSL